MVSVIKAQVQALGGSSVFWAGSSELTFSQFLSEAISRHDFSSQFLYFSNLFKCVILA